MLWKYKKCYQETSEDIIDPIPLYRAIRTESMDETTCGGTLTEQCRLDTQVPGEITSGDTIYGGLVGNTVFDGGGLYYRMRLNEWSPGEGSRVCQVSSLGVINIYSICV